MEGKNDIINANMKNVTNTILESAVDFTTGNLLQEWQVGLHWSFYTSNNNTLKVDPLLFPSFASQQSNKNGFVHQTYYGKKWKQIHSILFLFKHKKKTDGKKKYQYQYDSGHFCKLLRLSISSSRKKFRHSQVLTLWAEIFTLFLN